MTGNTKRTAEEGRRRGAFTKELRRQMQRNALGLCDTNELIEDCLRKAEEAVPAQGGMLDDATLTNIVQDVFTERLEREAWLNNPNNWLKEIRRFLRAWVRKGMLNRTEADELESEALERYWATRRGKPDAFGSFRYRWTIVKNLVLTHRTEMARQRKRTNGHAPRPDVVIVKAETALAEPADPRPGPVNTLEQADEVQDAVAQLREWIFVLQQKGHRAEAATLEAFRDSKADLNSPEDRLAVRKLLEEREGKPVTDENLRKRIERLRKFVKEHFGREGLALLAVLLGPGVVLAAAKMAPTQATVWSWKAAAACFILFVPVLHSVAERQGVTTQSSASRQETSPQRVAGANWFSGASVVQRSTPAKAPEKRGQRKSRKRTISRHWWVSWIPRPSETLTSDTLSPKPEAIPKAVRKGVRRWKGKCLGVLGW